MGSLISPDVLNALLQVASDTPFGDFAELGVYRGGSALRLYELCRRQGRTLHLFDTFAGIPLAGVEDRHPVGAFADGVDLAALRACMPDAAFHVGVFPASMPAALDNLAFVHIDCDQYQTTLDAIDQFWPRLVEDGVLWFDDVGTLPGARKAVLDRFGLASLLEAPEGRWYIHR